MSQQVGFHDITLTAAADLSAKRYYFCKISAEYTVNVAGNAAEDVIGIIQDDNATAAGQGVLVRPIPAGVSSWLTMGAAVAAGAPVTSGAAGKGRTAVSGEAYFARALQAATADGDIVEVHLTTGRVP